MGGVLKDFMVMVGEFFLFMEVMSVSVEMVMLRMKKELILEVRFVFSLS